MKKIIAIIFSVLFLSGMVTSTYAVEISKIGLSVSNGIYDVAGTEREDGEVIKESIEAEAPMAEIFAEVSINDALTLGLAYVPFELESEETVNTLYANPDGGKTTGQDTGDNKAKVNIQNHTTLYVLAALGDTGAYIKAAGHYFKANTVETLASGGAYGDADVYGASINLGYEHDLGDTFVRIEAGFVDYENISLQNQNNSAVKVEADIEGEVARISVGKSF